MCSVKECLLLNQSPSCFTKRSPVMVFQDVVNNSSALAYPAHSWFCHTYSFSPSACIVSKKKDLILCSLPLEGSCSIPWILFPALSIPPPTPISPSWDTEPGLHTWHSRCGTCQLNTVAKCCHLLCFQSSFWWCPMLLPFCLPLHIAMMTWEMRQQWLQGLSLLSCGCQLWVQHHIGTD